jgi:predicted transposase YbfD/YdcC
MGCQYEIADKIVGEKKGDYVFSLKGNQENLNDAVKEYWDELDFNKPAKEAKYIKFKTFSTNERGHGREGRRDYAISDDMEWIKEGFPLWKSIRTIGMVEATRETGDKKNTERRYFVSSLNADEELFAQAVCGHWGIENTLHYALDVVYREDACRIRDGYSPQNINLIRKIASTVSRSDKGSKTKAEFKRWDGLMIIWRVCFLALTSSKITPIFSLHSALALGTCCAGTVPMLCLQQESRLWKQYKRYRNGGLRLMRFRPC